ncbi:hypothetical protein ACOSP7_005893 [Xanthoceras sorbifolium]|uniref:Uncharacterized protein n=1 Tax=Xanthoceras sorbifolium TaxID=99658 RepID=A0ABQ8IDX4_9ROSI|nr:hypothetical protein JRO89_XS02G0009800 [Xanthoceras sorbifolium]
MEEPNNTNKNPTTILDNIDFSFNSDSLLHNGGDGFYNSVSPAPAVVSDIELISLQVATYTSLKDLLPTSSSSPQQSVTSPSAHNSSWHEIPIRNPLVKQAALAYLQPMSSPLPDSGNKGLLGRLRDGCCCWWRQCECFSWVDDVVFRSLREVFCWDSWEEEDDEKVD